MISIAEIAGTLLPGYLFVVALLVALLSAPASFSRLGAFQQAPKRFGHGSDESCAELKKLSTSVDYHEASHRAVASGHTHAPTCGAPSYGPTNDQFCAHPLSGAGQRDVRMASALPRRSAPTHWCRAR